jgi:hypothetical protein
MRKLIVAGTTAAVFAALLILVQRAEPQVGYSITWSPAAVSEVVALGASTSVQVSVASKTNLQNITLQATPSLVPFLTLQPSSVTTLTAGQPQNIQITFSIPSATPVGSYNGTVHVRIGTRTLSQTLKVAVVVSQTPVIVSVPTNFQPNSQVISQGGPMLLNNFGSQYQNGGLVPPGGAEISITTNTLPRPPLSSFISNELQGATITSTSSIMVSGSSCTEVFYSDSYGKNYNYSNIAVYCPHNGTLYKLFLFYTAGDPATAQFLGAFQQVLNTVQFTL